MSDHDDTAAADDGDVTDPSGDTAQRAKPPRFILTGSRARHVVVLVGLLVLFAVGAFLVVDGQESADAPTSPTTTVPSPPLRRLGVFANDDAAKKAIVALDPKTLQARPGTTTSVPAPATTVAQRAAAAMTEAAVNRCQPTLVQQTPDRKLGQPNAAAALVINGTPYLVTSHTLAASGKDPAGVRILISNATSCQVKFAITD